MRADSLWLLRERVRRAVALHGVMQPVSHNWEHNAVRHVYMNRERVKSTL